MMRNPSDLPRSPFPRRNSTGGFGFNAFKKVYVEYSTKKPEKNDFTFARCKEYDRFGKSYRLFFYNK